MRMRVRRGGGREGERGKEVQRERERKQEKMERVKSRRFQVLEAYSGNATECAMTSTPHSISNTFPLASPSDLPPLRLTDTVPRGGIPPFHPHFLLHVSTLPLRLTINSVLDRLTEFYQFQVLEAYSGNATECAMINLVCGKRSRRPWLVANQVTLPQKWPPPPPECGQFV